MAKKKEDTEGRKKRPLLIRLLRGIGVILGIVIIAAVLLIGYLTVTEFKPDPEMAAEITEADAEEAMAAEEEYTIVIWNLGYGALGDNADFFMDGGTGVMTADKARVNSNMEGILSVLKEEDADFILLQEVDRNSTRSHHIDETALLRETFPDMQTTFANNYLTEMVPYPIPPLGKVDSGIMTLSSYALHDAVRIALSSPFSWPVSTANLKRCLLVSRVKIEGSEHELVLINLHLEAYDSGEGKAAQTAQLRTLLEEEAAKGNYVIAAGDFNQIFTNVDPDLYPAQEGKWQAGTIDVSEFDPSLQFLMDADVPTCRSLDQPFQGADKEHFQYYMLDGFIVSDNIDVTSCTTRNEDFVCSDHNPVRMTFRLK